MRIKFAQIKREFTFFESECLFVKQSMTKLVLLALRERVYFAGNCGDTKWDVEEMENILQFSGVGKIQQTESISRRQLSRFPYFSLFFWFFSPWISVVDNGYVSIRNIAVFEDSARLWLAQ